MHCIRGGEVMTNGLKLLVFAAATIITCVVISIGFLFSGKAKIVSHVALNKLQDYQGELTESEITMYDGLEVMGSDVVNFIKKNMGDYNERQTAPIEVTVITVKSPERAFTYHNNIKIKDIQNFTKDCYIKPTNRFVGSVVKNKNNVITKLVFTIQ